jgi:hypothetical protein
MKRVKMLFPFSLALGLLLLLLVVLGSYSGVDVQAAPGGDGPGSYPGPGQPSGADDPDASTTGIAQWIPPQSITVTQTAITVTRDTPAMITATVGPPDTSTPVTYTWQTEGRQIITDTGGLSSVVTHTWTTPKSYAITVTAKNASDVVVTATQRITVTPKGTWNQVNTANTPPARFGHTAGHGPGAALRRAG